MTVPIVLYDACVLYPAPLRDLLMHLALTDLFRAKWSNQIHEEWIRNVLKSRPDLKRMQLESTRKLMDKHVRDCLVKEYEHLIEAVTLPDLNDRHVLAAAIQSEAKTIITYNLKDFPNTYLSEYGISALHPDLFISDLIQSHPVETCLAVRRHRASLRNPPKSIVEYFETLKQQRLPETINQLLIYAEIL